MAYTVTITNKYLDPVTGKVLERNLPKPDAYTSETIYSTMQPTGSYVDSVAYMNGYPNKDDQFTPTSDVKWSDNTAPYSITNKLYERSIYATNHYDYGNLVGLDLLSAFAETLIPLGISFSQFAVSDVAQEAGKLNSISFTVEDYTAAFYYLTLAKQMKDQGIEITVVEKAAAADDSGEETEPTTPEVGS